MEPLKPLQPQLSFGSLPTIVAASAETPAYPLLAVFAEQSADDAPWRPLSDDPAIHAAVQVAYGSGDFKADAKEIMLLYGSDGIPAERLLLIGLGNAGRRTADTVRSAAGTAVRFAMEKGVRKVALGITPASASDAASMQAVAEGLVLAYFDADTYKTDRKDRSVTEVRVLAAGFDAKREAVLQQAFRSGVSVAESVNFTRSLVLEPGNVLTPSELARRSEAMASEVGLSCDVHSTDFLREQKMNAFLAVAQGSAEPPAFIVLRYEPEQAPAADAPLLALVGKGITFDTGGISIKPADGMEKMKYDMAGAAAMLGAIRAIALLKPAVRVVCLVCSAENMPSGTAYKPGDIVTAMSGKTIEVMNTDAEGRMVLADGLHYAREVLGATHLIDAATLTGACVIALGKRNAGLFSNDDATAEQFAASGKAAAESFWRLPCTDDYREDIKSQIADIQNTGRDRWGGAITAAMFLKEFVADTPWIHLDIAGMAWNDEQRTDFAKGPSGFAVRSIVNWANSYAAS